MFHFTSIGGKLKRIDDFRDIFKFFNTNCPKRNVCKFLAKNPFASILFEPKQHSDSFVKHNLPAFIIGYNQLTYIKNMVKQLEKYTSDITIIDNQSDFQPLLDYYINDFKYTLLRQKDNFGHRIYRQPHIQKLAGDLYVLTDPDIRFNGSLPHHFIQDFINISNYFNAARVGFALFN